MIKKAMLIGVGVGREVEYALYSSIKSHNPNFVTFIVTKQSKDTLDRIIAEKGKSILNLVSQKEILVADNPEDLNDTFHVCKKALCSLLKEGYLTSEIVVDITSGTKVMSATIASLAILYRLYEIVYVGGKRDERGIVIKGSEKPASVKPMRILQGHDLNRIKDYFAIFQFEAAKKVVEKLQSESWFLEESESQRIVDIKEVTDGFISWERFDHKEALKHFRQAKLLKTDRQQKYLEDLITEHNHIAAQFSSQNPNLKGNVPTTYLIADVFQNARRRSSEGNYDDAVARLYRCLEMVVQYVLLLEYNLSSSDIDLKILEEKKIPDILLQKLASKRNGKQNIEVGLIEGFELLSVLDKEHPVTIEYLTQKETLKKSLAFRNSSILAHGITPVDREKYVKMENVIRNFIAKLIPDIDDRLKQLEDLFLKMMLI
jgi:CRISPR-associated protein (TIGR02710 family)